MTRNEMIARIAEIEAILAKEEELSQQNSANFNMTEDANVQRILDAFNSSFSYPAYVLPVYKVTGAFQAWYLDNKRNTVFTFKFQSDESRYDEYKFDVDFSTDGFITKYRTVSSGAEIDSRTTPEEFNDRLAKIRRYGEMIGLVLDYFSKPCNVKEIVEAINAREKFEFVKTDNNVYDLKTEKADIEMQLRRVDLNIAPGSVVEYNNTYWRRGYEHDNWVKVRINNLTKTQVSMTMLYDKEDGTIQDGYSFRKKFWLHYFRSVAEGDAARAAAKAEREKREAEYQARCAAMSKRSA